MTLCAPEAPMTDLSHPDIRATQCFIASKYVWPSMNKDIRHWTCTCLACQRAKVQIHARSPIGQFQPSDATFDHVHVDLVDLLPPVHGYAHLLTCVGCLTCWLEVIPLTNTCTEMVIQAFLFGRIASASHPPSVLTEEDSLGPIFGNI